MINEKAEAPLAKKHVTRVFGQPLSLIVRFVLLSILIGAILHVIAKLHDQDSISQYFNFDPNNLLATIERLIRVAWNLDFESISQAVVWLLRYFLFGAAIVIPIWIIMRLVNAPRRK